MNPVTFDVAACFCVANSNLDTTQLPLRRPLHIIHDNHRRIVSCGVVRLASHAFSVSVPTAADDSIPVGAEGHAADHGGMPVEWFCGGANDLSIIYSYEW